MIRMATMLGAALTAEDSNQEILTSMTCSKILMMNSSKISRVIFHTTLELTKWLTSQRADISTLPMSISRNFSIHPLVTTLTARCSAETWMFGSSQKIKTETRNGQKCKT